MLQNIKITTLDFNWNTKYKNYKKEILELLPQRKEQILEFDCLGYSAMANAIRRTVLDELETRAMFANFVDTNDVTIIRDEVLDRIKFIPVQQFTVNKSETGTLYVHNTSQEIRIVKSQDIQGITGVMPDFRIAVLNPGDYIKIPEITTRFGKGYENSCWTLSGSVRYDTNDYMDVHYINNRGNRPTQRVRVLDLQKHLPKEKNIRDCKILIIRDKEYWKKLQDDEKSRIELANYDYKIFNEKNQANFIPHITSLETMPNSWHIKIQTHGNVDPKLALRKILENIMHRLISIQTNKNVKYETETQITKNGPENINYMHIFGETHTIAELIIQNTYFLDPAIPLIKKHMNHPSENNISIIAIHSDFAKLMNKSLEDLVKKYKSEIQKL